MKRQNAIFILGSLQGQHLVQAFTCCFLLSAFLCGPAAARSDYTQTSPRRIQNDKIILSQMGSPDIVYTKPNGNRVLIYKYKTGYAPPPVSPSVGVANASGRPVIIVQPPTPPDTTPLALVCTIEVEINKRGAIVGRRAFGNCPRR